MQTPAPKFLTIDSLLVPLTQWIFLHPVTAFIFWLSLPIFAFPFVPFLFLGICWGIAALCLVLYQIRRQASASKAPIDWSREIVVITGGPYFYLTCGLLI